jgi:Protein of unknown function (DUF3800)
MEKQTFNLYCDESCHLERDQIQPMLFGCIWAPREKVAAYGKKLKLLKQQFALNGELKWQKVSSKNIPFYNAVVDWFFSEDDLHFRALVVPDKSRLDHTKFNQTHDDFYYKMYFWLLNKIVFPGGSFKIYLDVKDTRSRVKVRQLRQFLCFDKYDFDGDMIEDLRNVRSHEVQLMQLADFLLGAVAYRRRKLTTSIAKLNVAKRIESYHGSLISEGTPRFEHKFNVFVWQPRKR